MSSHETPGDRYSLEGLAALYTYEPSLRDVYVEGRTDAGLITWYLRESGLEYASVFAIDERVDIPASVVMALDLGVGARGRAIALAAFADKELKDGQPCLTVVIDADFGYLEGLPEYSCLLATDEPAMEGYALHNRPLEKLLRVSLHLPRNITAAEVRAAIIPALNDVFSVRFVLHRHAVGCVDDIAASCTLSTDGSKADMQELIRRSLSGIRKKEWPESLEDLTTAAEEARQVLVDLGHVGRGHDISVLLIAFLGLKGVSAHRENVEMAMRSCFEVQDLDAHHLFQALKKRIAA